jgi:C1A family cysteine protease
MWPSLNINNYFFTSPVKPTSTPAKYIYNWKRGPVDTRDFDFEEHMFYNLSIEPLPSKFSLRESMPPVLDQKSLGSCTANATANALHFCLNKEKQVEFAPSRLYMYYYTRLIEGTVDEDSGAMIRDCMKELKTYGSCHESLWPYDISKFAARPKNKCTQEGKTHLDGFKYLAVRQKEESIKRALVNGYPIIFGCEVYSSFESDEAMRTGDIPMPDLDRESLLGGHAIILCGFCDETRRFTFENSWGEKVGDKGYFTLPYEYVLDPERCSEFYTITFWK